MSWFRCCYCGRFVKYKADSSVPFGDSTSVEPPEAEYYCEKCITKLKARAIKSGWLPTNWIPAKWEIEVAKIIGLKRAGPRGCAWAHWVKELPEGWVEWY